MLICTCDGTVTGFGLANPKLHGEREAARQMLADQPANRPAPVPPWSPTRACPARTSQGKGWWQSRPGLVVAGLALLAAAPGVLAAAG